MIAKQRTRLTRPESVITRLPSVAPSSGLPSLSPAPVARRRTDVLPNRLSARCARQRRDHETASFGLPPGIDTGHFSLPIFFQYHSHASGLMARPRNRECAATNGRYPRSLFAFRHQRADRRGCGIENIDLCLSTTCAIRAGVGQLGTPSKSAWSHRRPAGRTASNCVRSPAHIGGAPVDITRMIIKDIFKVSAAYTR